MENHDWERLHRLTNDEPLPEEQRRRALRGSTFEEGKQMESSTPGKGVQDKTSAGSSPAPSANSEITEEWIRDNVDMYTRTVQVPEDQLRALLWGPREAIYGFYEDQYPSYEDRLFHELQDPNPVKAEEVNRIVERLKKAEKINQHVKEHMDLLRVSLWEAQQAYDKLRDELGLNPLFEPQTEDTLRDVPALEKQGSGVRIPGLPPKKEVFIEDIVGKDMALRIRMVTGLTKLPVPETYNVGKLEDVHKYCDKNSCCDPHCARGHIVDNEGRFHIVASQADGAEPIGEEEVCKTFEEGSIPSGTSIFERPFSRPGDDVE